MGLSADAPGPDAIRAAGVVSSGKPNLDTILKACAYRPAKLISSQEFARESLRRAILSGQLPLGAHLTQSGIARALDMSTTPVREALRDLASDGLVDIGRYLLTSVHKPTVAEMEEVYDLRKILETHAIKMVVRSRDTAALDAATEVQKRLDKTTDPAEWLLLNAEFHTALTSGANSPRLSSILDTLRGSVSILVGLTIQGHPARRDESNAEHWGMLRACREGDFDRAVHLTQIHMDPTKAAVGSILS